MSADACKHQWRQVAKANPLIPGSQGKWRCIECNAPRRMAPVQLRHLPTATEEDTHG